MLKMLDMRLDAVVLFGKYRDSLEIIGLAPIQERCIIKKLRLAENQERNFWKKEESIFSINGTHSTYKSKFHKRWKNTKSKTVDDYDAIWPISRSF